MSSKRDYTDYLHDIIDHADKAMRFIQGVGYDDFSDNEEKVFAVVKMLEIIGEAARHLPRNLRAQYDSIPWKQVIGMRNRLTHEYFSVDLEVVWRTLHEDLPRLRTMAEKMLADKTRPDSESTSSPSSPN